MDLAYQRHDRPGILEAGQGPHHGGADLRHRVVEPPQQRQDGVFGGGGAQRGGGSGADRSVGVAEHPAEGLHRADHRIGGKDLGPSQADAALGIIEPTHHQFAGAAHAPLEHQLAGSEAYLRVGVRERLEDQPFLRSRRQLAQPTRRTSARARITLLELLRDGLGRVRPGKRPRGIAPRGEREQ